MARKLGAPESYDDAPAIRRRYPWKLWGAKPFVQWMIFPGTDYDGDPRKMDATIRTWAGRNGLGVTINAVDPKRRGRIVFCFYDPTEQHRPKLLHFEQFSRPSSMTADSAAAEIEDDAPRIVCAICGAVQERAPHLLHVEECLTLNPRDSSDFASLYARHREDVTNSAGLRKINQFKVTWSLEGGPE